MNDLVIFDRTDNPVWQYLSGLAPLSMVTQYANLRMALSVLSPGTLPEDYPWQALGATEINLVRHLLSKKYKPATINGILSAIRGIMRRCRYLRLIDQDQLTDIEMTVKSAPRETEPAGRFVPANELFALLEARNSTNKTKEVRDTAVLAMLIGTAMRRKELADLLASDVDRENETYRVNIRHGKGDKYRESFVIPEMNRHIDLWLEHLPADVPFFSKIDRHGNLHPQRLTGSQVGNVLKERQMAAGIEHLTPHDLRRTFITLALNNGMPIHLVAKQVGHRHIETTRRYDRSDSNALASAVSSLHIDGD